MKIIDRKRLRDNRYLGDSVYVGFDDDRVWLYAQDPGSISMYGSVGLSQAALSELVKWIRDRERVQNDD